jgi:hypothetical protein
LDSGLALDFARMVGFIALGAVSGVVGFRMLRLTWQTREFPEAAIGVHILVLVLGYVVEFYGIAAADRLGVVSVLLRGVGNLCYLIAVLVYLLFTWRVFRPTSRVAQAVALASIAALVAGWSGEVFTTNFDFARERFHAPWFWIAYVPRLVCMGWATGEALREYRLARRRLRIGLSDPVVTNRFLLWGLAALFEFLIFAVVGVSILRGTPADFVTGTAALFVSAFGMCAAVTILLAFLPPPFYRRWIEG